MIYQNFLNKTFFINLVFSFIPISFILGNLILNLNIALLIISTFYIFRSKVLSFQLNLFDKLILFFFFYVFFVGLFNYLITDAPIRNNEVLLKTILYLRFLVLYLVLIFLINKKIINFKIFFYISSACVAFVSLDIIYQFHTGYDIFGFEGNARRLGGPFGDEKIAGSYLQRFSFFFLFIFFIFSYFQKLSKNFNFILYLITSFLIALSIIYAGNRIPFFMFLITCFLIVFFKKGVKIQFLSTIFLTIGLLITLYQSNLEIKKHYGHFNTKVKSFLNSFSDENLIKENNDNLNTFDEKNYTISINNQKYRMSTGHVKDFYSGYKTWQLKPFFGGGVKTFKYNCPKAFYNCTTHPHNYYLEILSDLGVVGLIILSLIFILLIVRAISINENLIAPFVYVFISEIFPLKSTGSFFTTSNSTFIFLFLAIIAGIAYKKKIE